MPTISVNIICKNEEANIGACLDSILWVDEIIVADEMSRDRTLEICRQYPKVRVFQHQLFGESAKRQFALDHTTGEWVFVLDADEQCPRELRDEILRRMVQEPLNGFFVRMKYKAFGRWIIDSVPKNLRLFKRALAHYPNRLVHSQPLVTPPLGSLSQPVIHLSTTYATLGGFLAKQNGYTTLAARQLYESGRRVTPANYAACLLIKPAIVAARKYVLWGWKYGMAGFLLSALTGYEYFMSYAKLWELQRTQGNDPNTTSSPASPPGVKPGARQ